MAAAAFPETVVGRQDDAAPWQRHRRIRIDRSGKRVEHFQAAGPSEIATSLYLYDLRTPAEE